MMVKFAAVLLLVAVVALFLALLLGGMFGVAP